MPPVVRFVVEGGVVSLPSNLTYDFCLADDKTGRKNAIDLHGRKGLSHIQPPEYYRRLESCAFDKQTPTRAERKVNKPISRFQQCPSNPHITLATTLSDSLATQHPGIAVAPGSLLGFLTQFLL